MIGRLIGSVSGDGLRARALRGTALTVAGTASAQALRFGSNLILTRILFPEAFGLMALVGVIITGLNMFSDVGLRASVVQNPRGDEPAFLQTIWTFQILRGFVLAGIAVAVAGPMAAFYEEPMIAQLLPVAAIGLVIAGFNSTRPMTLGRHLMLARLTAIQLGSQAAGIAAMVVLALWLQSVWALVFGGLVSGIVTLVASHTLLPGRPDRIGLERSSVREIFAYGKFLTLATVATFFINSGDRAVLGRFVSLEEIAFYSIAFFLASAPFLIGRAIIDSVFFPLLARHPPSESRANWRNVARARAMVTARVLAMVAVPALVGPWLVEVLYDPRYHSAGPLLTLIALGAIPGVITLSYQGLLLASGQSGRYSLLVTIRGAILMVFFVIGAANFGVVGVALAPALVELIVYPVMVAMIRSTRGHDPLHDAGFALVGLGLAALVVTLHSATLLELLGPFLL
jgi:O-antigen/teichoic acid export membrane protein